MDASLNGARTASYYGRPIVKPHVWTPYIPLYFWLGGGAGVAAVQAALERARGNTELADVEQHFAAAAALVAPILLTLDLGVPRRFHHMLRVFKPTSPMSVGSWILSAFGGATIGSLVARRLGWADAAGALEVLGAALGAPLATYTAVLIADTATPVWHAGARELPLVFAVSGISAAGAVGVAFAAPANARPARRLMIGGALGLVATTSRLERRVGPLLAESFHRGRGQKLRIASTTCALLGATIGTLGSGTPTGRRIAAALVAAAGIAERFGILAAGKDSASDPRHTVEPQRERLNAP